MQFLVNSKIFVLFSSFRFVSLAIEFALLEVLVRIAFMLCYLMTENYKEKCQVFKVISAQGKV